jgi:hypothetical protein
LHQRWMVVFNRLDEFLGRFLKNETTRPTAGQN